jgi:hypothetical protein
MPRMSGLRKSPGFWALAMGAVGFAAGFFGPMFLSPDANQGPLLGIFITGPGGALAGLLLGFIFRILPFTDSVRQQALVLLCVALGLGTLWFSLPEPVERVRIIDGAISHCRAPAEMMPQAIAHWQQRVDMYKASTPRANWREDAARMLRESPGVIVEIDVSRRNAVIEHRKPWNRGKLEARGWKKVGDVRKYFGGGTCESYPRGRSVLLALESGASSGWPPDELPMFLGVPELAAVPAQYVNLLD